MAKIDVKTWREKSVPLRPSVVENVYFDDTFPNHLLLQNSSPFPLYMSVNPGVSSSSYDDVVPGYGIRIFARPTGTKQCYLYMQSNAVNNVYVGSWQGEFDPVTIMQTQDVISIDPTAKLGQVEVSAILTKLPAGDNLIGKVEVSNQLTVANVVTVTGEVEIKNDVGSPIPVGGSVGVNNFPATQAVSGTVAVSNLPATQAVSGTVGVNNFPATQAVSGTVAVSNLPATQAVSGTVGVNNFPATQAVESVGFTSQKVTAGAAGDISVKASAGKVVGIRAVGAVNIYLKDGAAQIWDTIAGGNQTLFNFPIACTTSIILNFSAAGDAYIIYK